MSGCQPCRPVAPQAYQPLFGPIQPFTPGSAPAVWFWMDRSLGRASLRYVFLQPSPTRWKVGVGWLGLASSSVKYVWQPGILGPHRDQHPLIPQFCHMQQVPRQVHGAMLRWDGRRSRNVLNRYGPAPVPRPRVTAGFWIRPLDGQETVQMKEAKVHETHPMIWKTRDSQRVACVPDTVSCGPSYCRTVPESRYIRVWGSWSILPDGIVSFLWAARSGSPAAFANWSELSCDGVDP